MLKRTSKDQTVPVAHKRFILLDPEIPVVEGHLPSPDQARTDIPTFTERELGNCRVIQTANNDGQGYYVEIDSGRFGEGLVKHFVQITVIQDLIDLCPELRLSPKVAKERRWTEEEKNVEREIIYAKEVVHPNVTKILAFLSPTGNTADINAIVMEGASLGTLEIYAKRAQLPDSTVKKYGFQLSDALRYCHEDLQLIHREVCPRNIYVHDNGNTIKIGNFGYARIEIMGEKTSNKGCETCYKAPEMIYNGALTDYSYPVDVYGWAMTLWSISHLGRKPFDVLLNQNPSLKEDDFSFRDHLEDSDGNRPAIREDLDPVLVELIKTSWANDTDARPPMSEIVTRLQRTILH